MSAYYNENDKFAAQWLRNLIAAGLIADGDVDDRSIEDVQPDDLKGFAQCHFFAGIGGWSYALRLAGWPDERPCWTGSCPCQPFSEAGKGEGFADERHLWPAWFWLITQREPPVIFGEQVASPLGLGWLDLVSTDLENAAYAFGALDLCAAGVGAPHIRQRAYWLADTVSARRAKGRPVTGSGQASGRGRSRVLADAMHSERRPQSLGNERNGADGGREETPSGPGARCEDGRVGDSDPQGCTIHERGGTNANSAGRGAVGGAGGSCLLADSDRLRLGSGAATGKLETGTGAGAPVSGAFDPRRPWDCATWIPCRDGKARPVEPGVFPLATGVPARVGRLRGYGNAIVPQVAAEFIRAYMEAQP